MSKSLENWVKTALASLIAFTALLGALSVATVVRSWRSSDRLVDAQIEQIKKQTEMTGQPTVVIQKYESSKK
jgi:hypothetical protein